MKTLLKTTLMTFMVTIAASQASANTNSPGTAEIDFVEVAGASSASSTSGGAGAGKVKFDRLSIKKYSDKASATGSCDQSGAMGGKSVRHNQAKTRTAAGRMTCSNNLKQLQ